MQKFFTFRQKLSLGVIATLFLLNISAWQYVFVLAGPHYLKVSVLDVGQGDSIFIQTPSMRYILIDGGPDSTVLTRLGERLPFWQKSLDVVLLTHPDADHINGLLKVLQKYQVDYVVWTGMRRDGANYQQWQKLLARAKERGTKVVIATSGDQIKNGNVLMQMLHPFESMEGQFFKESNDTGIVSRLTYGKNSFLFTADVSSAVEQALVFGVVNSPKTNLASDVLKVGHHGSKYSSSEMFLQAVNPQIAVISVGESNSYGHPTPEVLQRLEKFGINTLRTNQNGTVEIVSDGNIFNVSTAKAGI